MTRTLWQKVRVADLLDSRVVAINDGYRMSNSQLGSSGVPFVRGGDIQNGVVQTNVEDHIRAEFLSELSSKLVQAEDVAFITKGTVGRVGRVRSQSPFVVAPQVCYWRSLDTERLDPGFLYTLLTGSEFQNQLNGVKTHGSMAADYVSLADQRSFSLSLPPIDVQRAIGRIASALDDKIELNRQTNETLEAMARALFKSWFVDFDPVRAKMAGRAPCGMDAATAALFPSDLTDGGIPATSRICRLCDVIDLAYGKALKAEDREPGPVPVYGSGGRVGWHASALAEGPGIVVGRKGNAGAVSWSSTAFYAIDTAFYVIAKNPETPIAFVFHELLNQNLAKVGVDSAVPGLNRTVALMNKVVWPATDVQKRFATTVSPWRARIDGSELESRTLAELRDLLLPKLLSGELRIRDAEKVVEAVI